MTIFGCISLRRRDETGETEVNNLQNRTIVATETKHAPEGGYETGRKSARTMDHVVVIAPYGSIHLGLAFKPEWVSGRTCIVSAFDASLWDS
jgi:hypothetical protein